MSYRNAPDAEVTYRQRTPRSAETDARGLASLPIASSRGISFYAPYPVTIARGSGPFLHDIDGNRYIDLHSNFFSLIHGNAFPPITEAVSAHLARGTAWSANNTPQIELAEQITGRVPSVDQVLFNNSGTEAFSLALNLCRGATGRYKFLMAAGGYHGSMYDAALGSKGLPGPNHYVAPYGDTDAFVAAIDAHGSELAGVFVEGVMGAGGFAQAPDGFFAAVKQACRRVGAVFVLDEVISLRLAPGGYQALHGIEPDLTMMGKIIGGGFPIGAVGGTREIMQLAHPTSGRVLASGTFSGNPLAMIAGGVSMRDLTEEKIDRIGGWAEQIERGLIAKATSVGLPLWTRRIGSLVAWYFYDPGPGCVYGHSRPDREIVRRHHLSMLVNGLFPTPRAALATSTAMSDALVDEVIDRLCQSLDDLTADLSSAT
jgi:glutamate-1-semialdehyde 2,1-aminomutase